MDLTVRPRVTRRRFLALTAGAAGLLGAPAVARPQTATLKITTWGGKWGGVMKGWALPAFEQEFRRSAPGSGSAGARTTA